jgi:hypothetical protein
MIVLFTVFNIISMHNLFVNFQKFVNLEQIAIGGLGIIILWIIRALIKVVYCQWKINKWDYFESLYPSKIKLTQEFTELVNLELKSKMQKVRLKDLTKAMEYFNLRDDFIDPHYLPSLGESTYRSDFPFSDYLSLCLSQDIKFYFRFKKSSYFLILFLLGYLMLASMIQSVMVMGFVISLIPVTCGFTILKARQRLNRIYRNCLSKSKHNELLNFAEMGNEFQIKFYPNFLKNSYKTKGKDLFLHRYKNR